MLSVLGLAGLLLLGSVPTGHATPAPPGDPTRFTADLVVKLPGSPETHVFVHPGSGVVALRVSIPVGESAEEAGAGQLVRALAEDRMRSMARRIGARASAERTSEGIVYQVAGPASEIDFLVWILNEGLRPPEADRFHEVRRTQLAEVLRRQETPQGVLALRVRGAAGGSALPLLGSSVALERMHAGVVAAVWARSHGRDRARIVAVGDITPEVVLSALGNLDLPATPAEPHAPPGGAVADPRPTPQIIRHWVAEAWPLERARDPRALVAVALLGDRIRETGGDYELGAEVWETGGRWTLVVSGAAYPRAQQAMRNRLRGLLAEAEGAVTDPAVGRHAARIRGEILLQASTPWGFADLVGEALDFGVESTQVAGVLDELATMDGASVRSFLAALQARTPIREEVRP
jgi:predicted Zn-dependent peptidase